MNMRLTIERKLVRLVLLIGIIGPIAISSCTGKSEYKRLLLAESLVETVPDSARLILNTIPYGSLKDERSRALHTLVTKWVDYRNFIDKPDDSLLQIARDYYRAQGDTKRLMMTGFLLSHAQLIGQKHIASVASGAEAMDMATQLNAYYYLGKITETIALDFCLNYNFSEGLRLNRMSAEYFRKCGKHEHTLYRMVDVGKCQFTLGKNEESLATLDSVLAQTTPADSVLRSYAYEAKIRPNLWLGRIKEAKEAADSMVKIIPHSRFRSVLIPALMCLAQNDSAGLRKELDILKAKHVASVNEMDMLYLDYWLNVLCKKETESMELFQRLHQMKLDSFMVMCNKGDEMRNILENYQKGKAHKLKNKVDNYEAWIAVIGVTLLIVLIVFRSLYIRRKKKMLSTVNEKELRIKHLLSELDNQKSALESFVMQQDKLSNENIRIQEGLMQQQFTTINCVCQDYYEKRDASDKVRISVLKDIQTHLSQFAEEGYITKLEAKLNSEHNGVVDQLHIVIPDLKYRDKVILLLSMTPLNAKAICVICQLKDKAYYYNRRRQLREKIEASGSPYAHGILGLLK